MNPQHQQSIEPLEPRIFLSATLLADLYTASSFSPEPETIIEAGGVVFFIASDNVHGRELWRLDADDRMQLVADLIPGPGSSSPCRLFGLDDTLLFLATLPGHGQVLMRSDGSVAGTTRIRGFRTEPDDHDDRNLDDRLAAAPVIVNGRFYFALRTGGLYHVWSSDGTRSGTRVLRRNISNRPQPFAGSDRLIFTADDPIHGQELWQSGGTRACETVLADILPGAAGSAPAVLGLFNDRLLVSATDGHRGRETWLVSID